MDEAGILDLGGDDGVKKRPILFNGPMVRAILDGRKTQTRRVIKPQSDARRDSIIHWRHCPFQVGLNLWVRETFRDRYCNIGRDGRYIYRADQYSRHAAIKKWSSAIHMPRGASRITLEVTGVRVERVQEITEDDAIAEGIGALPRATSETEPTMIFADLWDSLNAKRGYPWSANPFVWVVEFRRLTP